MEKGIGNREQKNILIRKRSANPVKILLTAATCLYNIKKRTGKAPVRKLMIQFDRD